MNKKIGSTIFRPMESNFFLINVFALKIVFFSIEYENLETRLTLLL